MTRTGRDGGGAPDTGDRVGPHQQAGRACAAELLDSGDGTGVGVEEFVDASAAAAIRRPASPRANGRSWQLVAEGKSNGATARALVVSEAAVAEHIGGILTKLDLPPADDTHRRVPAVLAYLRS